MEPPAPKRRRRGRWIALGIGLLAVLWIGLVARQVLAARRAIDAGVQRLEDARSNLTPGDVVRGKALGPLSEAHHEFDDAHSAISSPLVTPFRVLPVIGRQVRSADAMTDAAARVVSAGEDAMRDARATLRKKPHSGTARLDLVDQLRSVTARAEARIRRVDLGPTSALVSPLAKARNRFADKLFDVRRGLNDAHDVVVGMGKLLRGPRRYLVLAANNGEMRAGSGMFLSAGVLTFEHGNFDLGEMTATEFLEVPAGAVPVPVTGDLEQLWGWIHPTQDFRDLATSPRFEVTAPLAAAMWKQRTGQDVDGVMAVDPLTLRALLAAEGPVTVNGRELDAKNVVPFLLLEQYRLAGPGEQAQQARRDQQSEVARAAIDALDKGDWTPSKMVDQLRGAARGRHVLAWSRHADEQRAWRAAGVAGEMHGNSLMVAINSAGGDKLDQFLEVESRLEVRPGPKATEATLQLRLRNTAPTGLPQYVSGPDPGSGVGEGVYSGFLSVSLPGSSRNNRIEGIPQLVGAGADGPTRVVAGHIVVPRGEEAQFTVHFELPPGLRRVRVESSARHPAELWHFRSSTWTDDSAKAVHW